MISNWWENNKRLVIMMGIVGVLLALFLVTAITRVSYEISMGEASEYAGKAEIDIFQNIISQVWENILVSFGNGNNIYREHLKIFAIIFAIFTIFIMIKKSSKNEYDKIEHGSGDWCKNGEEYRVLSNKSRTYTCTKEILASYSKSSSG